MFISIPILCTGGIMATAVNGYKLAFHSSASGQCRGQFLGSWSGGSDAGCRTDYVGVAQDVVVTNDRDGDHDNTVIFFSSDDCNDANAIVMSQGGCMTIDSDVSSYSSFKVLDATTRGNRDNTENLGSHGADVPPAHHGDAFEYDNAIYRWHQLAQGVWSGVLADEWDDNIHVAGNDVLDTPEPTHLEM
ncbi:hypothetical protein P168DRAFT_280879 [Aspergillus campestris IBT 28561]|uniref:Uncharacterized protein n=1 Tax=Aspergillus campestris (strain IBT 28561) TaxID=1392248 RepID=A0A2I1D824_ASPC2|nr:uncharacterized protein P168DRAFT_280879 [Aspergillus campestris IBT 28561]PKY06024.1 hypothetical protein P168DRAFT_280879 [Aspergillus campestris IBT 28561]